MSLRILTTFNQCGKSQLLTTNFRALINPTTFTGSAILSRSFSIQTPRAMRFIRFQKVSDNTVRLGSLSDDGKSVIALDKVLPNDTIELIKSNVSNEVIQNALKSSKWEPLTNDIKLLAPIENPEKIICIGLNYLGHCQEQNKEAPKEPMFFSKYASTITGPSGDVILHEITKVRLLL